LWSLFAPLDYQIGLKMAIREVVGKTACPPYITRVLYADSEQLFMLQQIRMVNSHKVHLIYL
jgi:hypothetical protein